MFERAGITSTGTMDAAISEGGILHLMGTENNRELLLKGKHGRM